MSKNIPICNLRSISPLPCLRTYLPQPLCAAGSATQPLCAAGSATLEGGRLMTSWERKLFKDAISSPPSGGFRGLSGSGVGFRGQPKSKKTSANQRKSMSSSPSRFSGQVLRSITTKAKIYRTGFWPENEKSSLSSYCLSLNHITYKHIGAAKTMYCFNSKFIAPKNQHHLCSITIKVKKQQRVLRERK